MNFNSKLSLFDNISYLVFIFVKNCIFLLISGCTGVQSLCPPSSPECHNGVIPTVPAGTPCRGPCKLFFGLAHWCCTQDDGCPADGSQTELWGWCTNQCQENCNFLEN